LLPLVVTKLFANIQIYPYPIIVVAGILGGSLITIPTIIFRVSQKPLFYGIITTGQILISQCLSVIFVINAPFGYSKMLGMVLSNLLIGGSSLVILLLYGKKYSKKVLTIDFVEIKKGVVFGYPLIATSILTYLSNSFDVLIISWFLSANDLGIYSVGLTISGGISVILVSLYQLTEPDFFRIAVNEDEFKKKGFGNLLLKTCSIINLLGTIGCFFMIPLGRFLISRPEFYKAVTLLPLITCVLIIRWCNTYSLLALNALGKTLSYPALTAVQVIFVILFEIIGIKIIGLSGVPVGIFIGNVIFSFIIIKFVIKKYRIKIEKTYAFLMVLVSCLLLIFSYFLLSNQYMGIIAAIISSLFSLYLSFRES